MKRKENNLYHRIREPFGNWRIRRDGRRSGKTGVKRATANKSIILVMEIL